MSRRIIFGMLPDVNEVDGWRLEISLALTTFVLSCDLSI
jgi:hypothetical protein